MSTPAESYDFEFSTLRFGGTSCTRSTSSSSSAAVYTIAMARTSAPHSASAQFFINVKNNSFLDYPGQDGWGYCVFGKVVEGTEVVDKIKSVKTTRVGMFADVPVEDVAIEKAEVV